jgi:pimeloyl-ACP methyl ester carboxylesterase
MNFASLNPGPIAESSFSADGLGGSSGVGLANAIYFDSGAERLFGWLHSPPGSARASTGLLICKPFGYEAICAHRSLRAFSEAAVQIGMPTLRFDYLGTGDSADIDPTADQLAVWTRDVVTAVSELQKRTGVQQICLLGVRLGALIAMLAARECAAVTSMILISPIISGRRYLRDLRITRLAAALGHEDSPADTPPAATAGGKTSIEVSGFSFSAATLATLEQLDLKSNPIPLSSDVLVIDGRSFPTSKAWSQQISELGSRVEYQALPGLIEMIMTAPQWTTPPAEMIAASQDWLLKLLDRTATSADGAVRHALPPAAPTAPAMTLVSDGTEKIAELTERPVFFGSDVALFGVVTEPRRTEIRRRAVILLNAGADLHVGVNGINVRLARQWAGRGYVVLRMDLAGLGDSATRTNRPDNEVFPPAALDDIKAAMDMIRSRYGVSDITLFGLCSGAYHALRAAAAGLPVNRILMVNPQNYFWRQGMALDAVQIAEVIDKPKLYNQLMFSAATWKRLLRGQINVLRVAKVYFYRPFLELESKFRDLARYLRVRLPLDLGRELEEIDRRGVKIVFVFSRGEPGLNLLKIEAGSSVKRLSERYRLHVIDGADHVFSQSGPRATLREILSEELFSRR